MVPRLLSVLVHYPLTKTLRSFNGDNYTYMIYYTDGFCENSNPSRTGGGYTITNKKGKVVKQGRVSKVGFTNNEAELLGIFNALKRAKKLDTIITDSQICLNWVLLGKSAGRKDLNEIAQEAKTLLKEKSVALAWLPREVNLAGHYNEEKYKA